MKDEILGFALASLLCLCAMLPAHAFAEHNYTVAQLDDSVEHVLYTNQSYLLFQRVDNSFECYDKKKEQVIWKIEASSMLVPSDDFIVSLQPHDDTPRSCTISFLSWQTGQSLAASTLLEPEYTRMYFRLSPPYIGYEDADNLVIYERYIIFIINKNDYSVVVRSFSDNSVVHKGIIYECKRSFGGVTISKIYDVIHRKDLNFKAWRWVWGQVAMLFSHGDRLVLLYSMYFEGLRPGKTGIAVLDADLRMIRSRFANLWRFRTAASDSYVYFFSYDRYLYYDLKNDEFIDGDAVATSTCCVLKNGLIVCVRTDEKDGKVTTYYEIRDELYANVIVSQPAHWEGESRVFGDDCVIRVNWDGKRAVFVLSENCNWVAGFNKNLR